MPDWSYQTVFKPILFRMPVATARKLSLGVMGMLGRSPIGPFVIDFMGHMKPDVRLRESVNGIEYTSPTGLGANIDIDAAATSALARFGFGFIEIGPVTLEPGAGSIKRDDASESITLPFPTPNPGASEVARRLRRHGKVRVRIAVQLQVTAVDSAESATSQITEMTREFDDLADEFSIDIHAKWPDSTWVDFLARVRAMLSERFRLWLVLSASLDPAEATRRAELAQSHGFGVWIDGAISETNGSQLGRPAKPLALALVQVLRERFGELAICASGGIHEPADALEFRRAGANLIVIDTGLVFSGPGLPKRVNAAIVHLKENTSRGESSKMEDIRLGAQSWFWLALMGLSMLIGGLMAFAIAVTRVVLPYDEHFVGYSREAFSNINSRLIAFMAHDRVTLAGTMVTIGVMYCGLAFFGVRKGVHWASVSIQTSAFIGFLSFFLFLGFGYFDPFHAFVSAILFQFLVLGFHCRLGPPLPLPAPELHNTARWRRALWGQLLFVAQAAAFIVAGSVISYVGITSVFVPEDLHFMETTARDIGASNPRVLSLIAHDRASFGGMLISSGIVFLTSALWGFRRGARWFWWTTLIAGLAGYCPAIGVHFAVGYENLWHLAPAFIGLAMFLTGSALAYDFCCREDPELAMEWTQRTD